MWPVVTRVAESKLYTWNLQGCCNRCRFHSGSGKRSVWTLSQVCRQHEGGDDSIWVIVDRLTKSAHFVPVKNTYRPPEYADIYMAEIVKLHGIPKTIISDRGPQFTAHFWERMHKSLGTSLIRSTAYHPQTSVQTEKLNQVLKDMLRACVLSVGYS